MAHLYADFAAAYYAFSEEFESAKQYETLAFDNVGFAYAGALDPVDKLHFGYLCGAVYQILDCINYIAHIRRDDYQQSPLYESIYWGAQGNGNGGVTMDAILTAMITAEFSQLQKFVGIEDAYRVALWNEPFNAEFYSALARGFTE